MGRGLAAALVAATLVIAAPATAQNYSDAYTFLKAVKERDGEKVASVLSQPGTIAINARERGTGEGALHIVTRARDLTWLTYLLGKGARADLQNEQGNSALSIAAQLGWTDGAQVLLARKASVDLPNSRGETPLILAVQRRDIAMVRLLLERGANPKKADSVAGLSAIDYAAQDARSTAILKLLQESGETKAKPVAGPKL
ncbi:ankyrin repeat domain-containing protein [Sphingomonas parva]|uniref:Ankyrin repeat domain-containing protein n=1 Tax=Sphingomonas parva TaxID=2555898 RepID=A0A4Y8ZUB8_9SPHN|nr:ankyrin repeat domain-containing protein [Sphingomonas parva]